MKSNTKGQLTSVLFFVAIAIGLLILAPFLLKMVMVPLDKFNTAINTTSPAASQAVGFTENRFVGFFDYVIISIYFLNVITLLLSSFLIDIHPAFVIVYIIGIALLFVLGPAALDVATSIWGDSQFSDQVAQLPISEFLLNNFWAITLGVVIISGVIAYAKLRGGGSSGGY